MGAVLKETLFSYKLRIARESKGLTQQAVADMLGITRQAYQNYEKGGHPRTKDLKDLCELLGVSADWLLGVNVSREEEVRELSEYLVKVLL